MMKVTDLEKFALEEIWSPYWPAHPDSNSRPGNLETYRDHFNGRLNHGIDETAQELSDHPEWRGLVIGRLAAIGVRFPSYVQHRLVRDVLAYIEEQEPRP